MKLAQSTSKTHQIASKAETLALQYLQQHGLQLMVQNYHCRYGEIDLVMQDRQTLVFVEVKYRAKHGPLAHLGELITISKQRKLVLTAQHYLYTLRDKACPDCRFDAMLLSGSIENPEITWIKNAFEAENDE